MTSDALISAEFLCVGLGVLFLVLFVTSVLFAVWRSGKRAAWERSVRAYPICPKCRYPMRGLRRARGSMPFLVEIANGTMGSRHLFEAVFQVRLQRPAQAGHLLAAAHFA